MERRLGSIFDTTVLEKRLELNESNVDKKPLAERRRERDTLRRQISRRHNRMNQVHQMLRACILLKRDVDYIVTEGKVVLIDRVTGRRRPDSRYQHGLQAALESKERVTVHSEPDVLAEISVQGFMKQYAHVAGITGTAISARDEFRYAYGLDVVAVPPTRPSRRHDYPARLYASRREKLMAVLEEVRRCRRVGRPVLVGARTVEQSEEISRLLGRHDVAHRLLNAVNNAEEAHVVKSAGTLGAVTVATNMAGRGTDIVLGPGLDQEITQRYATLVKELLDGGAGQIVLSCASADEADALVSVLSAFDGVSVATEERNGSTEVRVRPAHSPGRGGETVRMEFELGLHVVGTELGESGRIDRQLRGRSGRQGENGSSRFFLSMEDHSIMNGAGQGTSGSGEKNSDVFGSGFHEGMGTGRRLREVQDIAEREDEVSRAATWDYNQVIERQTLGFYRVRRDVIDADGFLGACAGFMREKARRLVDQHLPPAMIGRYPSQFERIAEEAWLDYRVDCQPLFGLGIDALQETLAELMVAGLEEAGGEARQPRDRQGGEAAVPADVQRALGGPPLAPSGPDARQPALRTWGIRRRWPTTCSRALGWSSVSAKRCSTSSCPGCLHSNRAANPCLKLIRSALWKTFNRYWFRGARYRSLGGNEMATRLGRVGARTMAGALVAAGPAIAACSRGTHVR